MFTYTSKDEWTQPVYSTLQLTRNNTLYTLQPMPWNYTVNQAFNTSFAAIQVTNTLEQQTFVLEAVSSNIAVSPFNPSIATQVTQGVFLALNSTGQTQPLWIFPKNGQLVPTTNCIPYPNLCTWYVNPGVTQVRNLQGTLWACIGTLGPYASTTSCSYSTGLLPYLYTYTTQLIASSQVPIPLTITSFDNYATNNTQQVNWPFNVTFGGPGIQQGQQQILVQNLAFLTQAQVTYPCVCGFSGQIQNQSTLNEAWWLNTNGRSVNIDEIEVGERLLAANFSNGELSLVRSEIVSFDVQANTILVSALRTGILLDVYSVDARTISVQESVAGLPDCDLALTPFRCPDGGCSTASSFVNEISVCFLPYVYDGQTKNDRWIVIVRLLLQ